MHPLFRFLPLSLRLPIFYRTFSKWQDSSPALYTKANLALVPHVTMNLLSGDMAHRPIAYTGIYEWPVTRRIARLARKGGVLIDVGANAGYFSLMWAALYQKNRVEAFEALPRNVQRLSDNIAMNALADRIQIHSVALGERDGWVDFECGPEDQSGWGGIAAAQSANTIQVPVRRLDGMFPKIPAAVIVKIDCEGADSKVLEGAQSFLSSQEVKDVFFEVNEPRQAALGLARDVSQTILKNLGFHCEQIDAYDWHARKP